VTKQKNGATRLERNRASFDKDKAVKDNIVETWLCIDCGVNTQPGVPSGPEIRVAFAMGAEEIPTEFNDKTEVYDVKDVIWEQARMRPWSGCLCIGCLERRIGRQLRPRDFSAHDAKAWAHLPCTDRLLDRRGYARANVQTADGPKQIIVPKDVAPLIEGGFMEEEERP
jgi:hypothetical protein